MTSNTQSGTIAPTTITPMFAKVAKILLKTAGCTVITTDGSEQEMQESSVVLPLTNMATPNINGFTLANRLLGIDSQNTGPFVFVEAAVLTEACEALLPTELVWNVGRVRNVHTPPKGAAAERSFAEPQQIREKTSMTERGSLTLVGHESI